MKMNNILRFISAAAILASAALAVSCGERIETVSPQRPQKPSVPGSGDDGDGYFVAVSGGRGAETRAHLHDDVLGVGGYYHWDAGDRIGLVIAGGGATLVGNLPMEAFEGEVTHTTFTGELTKAQRDDLAQYGTFDYYSYFPYDAAIDLGAIPFTIPSSPTLTPNKLDLLPGVPMVAEPVLGGSNAVFLTSGRDEVPAHETSAHFNYKHLIAYAAIELDLSLVPAGQTISRIDITGTSPISGTFRYDMFNGTVSPGGGYGISVTIDGGLATGSGSVIYLPMAPVTVGNLTFEFHINGGTQPLKKTIPGTTFVAGKVHRLNVVPPAEFTASTTFSAPESGYYYIEAWGGNGGNGGDGQETGAAGGISLKQAGMFYIAQGTSLYVQVGTAGGNGGVSSGRAGSGGGTGGGVTGTWFGRGGNGGNGGQGGLTANGGSGGGGGGAASGVLLGGTDVDDIIIASSGGGGGGGGAGNSQIPGKGGDSDSPGDKSSNNGGVAGGQGVNPDSTWGETGDNGDGAGGNMFTRGGGGGGAGGGGFDGVSGGGGRMGNGGVPVATFGYAGAGGAGGASYTGTETPNTPGYNIHNYDRPGTTANGYVVITFFRP